MHAGKNAMLRIVMRRDETNHYTVTCPGSRDKKLIGCGLDEAVYWVTRLQLHLELL
jgi:hypothetical protein